MHIPEQQTHFVMDMIDYSSYQPDAPMSLDRLVTETYGREYVGQQTGDMINNDTIEHYDFTDPGDVEEALHDHMLKYGLSYTDEYGRYTERGDEDYYSVREYLADWLAAPEGKYPHDHIRQGLTPYVMLAMLIEDGHLPAGDYLIRVSW